MYLEQCILKMKEILGLFSYLFGQYDKAMT